ncbi:unnamed protein product [Adineta steineri]|uniref:Uncharacterized protein n=2 Tax=Adineta steineri TaxID=433720 RepID=A0A819ZNH4_9BILA|nr:unnamed protein product [Adineta steineri]CAF4175100.1 unnamed protein product [Adineta steineri]
MASTNDVELASTNDVGLASSHADIKRLEDQFRQYRDESQKEIQRLKEDVKKLKVISTPTSPICILV